MNKTNLYGSLAGDYKKRKYLLMSCLVLMIFSAVCFFLPVIGYAEDDSLRLIAGLGGGMSIYIFSMLQTINSSIDMPFGLGICALVATGFDMIPHSLVAHSTWLTSLKDMDMGLFEFWPIRVIIFVWFTVHLLLSFNCVSGTIKDVLRSVDTEFGKYANTAVIGINFILNSNLSPVHAAESDGNVSAARITVTAFSFIMVILLSFVGHYFMSLMFWAIDIILMPFKYAIPFSTLILQICKYLLILGLTAIAIINPWIFVWIFIVIFLISILLFRQVYRIANYFRYIYVRGSYRRVLSYFTKNYEISLMDKKYTKMLQKAFGEDMRLVIPVFVQIPFFGSKSPKYELTKGLKRYDRLWLISNGQKVLLCQRGAFGKYRSIDIGKAEASRVYIEKGLFNYTLYWVDEKLYRGERLGRQTPCYARLSMSREYDSRLEEIRAYTSFAGGEEAIPSGADTFSL